jgi:hypothetical protein
MTTLTAYFGSEADAKFALQSLHNLGVSEKRIRTFSGGRVLRVELDEREAAVAEVALERSRAIDVARGNYDPTVRYWISHQYGSITSRGVAPGEGDAEAGEPYDPPLPGQDGSAEEDR